VIRCRTRIREKWEGCKSGRKSGRDASIVFVLRSLNKDFDGGPRQCFPPNQVEQKMPRERFHKPN
jgi:hypothetical protein